MRFDRLILLLLLLALPASSLLAEVVVDTAVDGNDGECVLDCTIREAVGTAAPGETVVVPAGIYSISAGQIDIDRDLTIVGDGVSHTVIRGSQTPQRLFVIATGASVEISSLSLSLEPGLSNGGGIRNEGSLLLRDCWLRDSLNPLDLAGGALRNTVSGTTIIERCSLSNNNAEFAGAILNEGVMTLWSTTVSGNSNAFVAGGIINTGELTISDSTIFGNIANFDGAANIENFGSLVMRNSLVAGGVGGPDCTGPIDATAGHNLDGDGTCVASGGPGNLTAPALLFALADNGGPVPTHAPAIDSPLIDAGNPSTPGSGGDACLASDARGVARPQGGGCDIGAFELAVGQNCSGGAADDADGDGLCRGVDNCPSGFNPAQGPVVFPHPVVATSPDRFAWNNVLDVLFVRGRLELVDVLETDAGDALTAADSLIDDELPPAGSAFWYQVRLGGDCTVGSWQTRLGGQPERDVVLP